MALHWPGYQTSGGTAYAGPYRFVNQDLVNPEEAKKFFGTPEAKCLPVREGSVYRFFVADPVSGEQFKFSWKTYKFLAAYNANKTIQESANDAGMSVQQAERILNNKKVKKWIRSMAERSAVKHQWMATDIWWKVGEDWIGSKKEATKTAREAWVEFGKRCVPLGGPISNVNTIQVNIDPAAVTRALDKQRAIEAEISKELG